MKGRRVAALAAVAITSLAVTACKSSSDSANQPRTEMSAADAVEAAIGDLGTSSYAVEITSPTGTERESGTIDPATRTGTLSAGGSVQGVPVELDALLVSPDIWVKMDLGEMSDQYGIKSQSWMKLDSRKVSGDQALPFDLGDFGDALDMKKLLAGMDAERVDANNFSGTIDLTRASGVTAPNASDIAHAGDKAQRVPVSVAVDQQGRLIEVKIDGGSISPDLAVDIRFSDYGMPARVTRPDDNQVVPTPATVYQLLSGRNPN